MINAPIRKKRISITLTILGLFFSSASLFSQIDTKSVDELEIIIDSIINTNLKSQNIPGAAYILVDKEKTLLKKGFGFANLGDEKSKVNPDSTIFRIGSITKTFTTAALLQVLNNNRINLHDDVNEYLSSVRVPKTFDEPITFHHLLTHSAGFDELGGRRTFNKNELIPLGEFLSNNLLRIRKPGVVSSYSSHAIALAGVLVEDISKVSLEKYMRDNIWKPLKMEMTSITIAEAQKPHVSLGYEYHDGINKVQPWEWYHTYPSSEINSTVADMGNYMKMLLNLGVFNENQILSSEMALAMQQQQLSSHKEVDGFAYGFYRRTRNNVKTICHGGNMLGYSSFLTLIPEKKIGFFIINHHEGSNLRNIVNDAIVKYFSKEDKKLPKFEGEDNNLKIFEGEYRWMTYCHTCTETRMPRSRSLTLNKDNTLSGFGRKFYQIEPLLFKSFDGQRTMGFVKDEHGEIKYMSLGNINTFEKIK